MTIFNILNIFAISGLLVGIFVSIMAILMFVRGTKKFHYLWGIFCFTVMIWGIGGFMIAVSKDVNTAIFWWRVAYSGVIFIPILFVHFVHEFLKISKQWLIKIIYILGLFFFIINFIDGLFIDKVRWVFNQFYYIASPTPFYTIFVILFLGLVVYGHIQLWRSLKSSAGVTKTQIKYIFLATFLGFIGGSFSFLPVYKIDIYPFLNITISFSPIIVSYAILKHRLMDIKFVLRKSSVYLVSLSTIIISAIAVKYIVIVFFTPISNQLDYLILILAVSTFLPIKSYYYKLANKYFFTSLYDSRKVIGDLSDKLRSTMEVRKIYKYIADILMGSFHTKAVAILIQDKNKKRNKKQEEDQYILRYNNGFHTHGRKKFPGNKQLCNLFLKRNKSIVVEEIKSADYKKFEKTINLLTAFGAEIVTPLNVKGEVIGLIILGAKESGDMYNDEDLRVLEIIGAQAAIAVENALSYEKTRNFNVKLKKEVEEATAELREANEELKRMDAAKSEFISIASHQLRTPLTVIKGYISMLLEGSFGRLNEKEIDPLKKVFKSNDRLIKLVENLLDISRIESGRLKFNFKKIHLERIVDSVVNELFPIAQKKGLELKYKIANKLLPKVKIDEEKIRQVIINLLDNSIKYTEKGFIIVELSRAGKKIHFCVTDTGRGISDNELPNLFKKFSRGKGVFLIDTGGDGLGLYVSKMMIEAHHGEIWAESEGRDKGAKFCFTLPVGKVK